MLLVLLIPLGGCLESKPQPSESVAEASQDSAMEHAAKHLDPKYVCPMHPQIVRDEPGSCPICGMDLVEKLMDPMTGKRPEIGLSGAVIQSMGVRTARVVPRPATVSVQPSMRCGSEAPKSISSFRTPGSSIV